MLVLKNVYLNQVIPGLSNRRLEQLGQSYMPYECYFCLFVCLVGWFCLVS